MPLTRSVWRFRLTATCAALTALAFVQDPGLVAADTKLDLTANPWGFLGRALHLWDAQGFFGQLQNQAYGYFWPMGPAFGLMTSAGVPAWVAQRLWWSLLLCVGFLGVVRLARLLGMSRPAARWVAALAYVLAPRVMSTLGPISSETLAVMVAPWVLVPLVGAARPGSGAAGPSLRRSAAWSGVAVLCAGGVNAVATGAVLVLPFLWLVTRPPGALRRRLAAWWAVAVLCASLWWVVPLLTLGRYSPPFLDWIESAAITTGRTDIATALRGTDDWVAYVAGAGGPSWPAGWQLVATGWLVLLAGLVAAIGLSGVALARRHRGFLVLAVLTGVALLTLGHTGAVQGLAAGQVQDLLDAALAPLRNTHKFDLVLRLPLALGVGWAVTALAAPPARPALTARWRAVARAAALPVAAVLVLMLAYPALSGGLTRGRSYESLPQYWDDAARWLASAGDGRALVLPGSGFGTYLWGRSQDEPLQPLAASPWGIRDAVPLSSAGNIRLLDSIEARIETGRGSAGLTETLARSGIRFLVVRNDLDTVAAQAPRSVLVHETLDSSPGIHFVRSFGPPVVPFGTEGLVVDSRLDAAYAAVEIYAVDSPTEPGDGRVVLRDGRDVVSATTSTSDAVLALADAGLLDGRAAVLGQPVPDGVSSTAVLVDSYRRSEVDFGRMRDNRSASMTEAQDYTQARRVHDFPGGPTSVPATVALEGVRSVTASSSQAGVGTVDGTVPGASPYAAIDTDLTTAWQVRDVDTAEPSWWQVGFLTPTPLTGLRLALLSDPVTGARADRVTVVSDTGRVTTRLAPTDDLQPVDVPPGPTTTLRLDLPAPSPATGARVTGLREVVVPGVLVGHPLVVPPAPADGGVVLTARAGARDGCVTVPLRFPCGSALPRPGEDSTAIDRVVDVPAAGDYSLRMDVRLRPEATAGRLLDPLRPAIRASASSVLVGDPRARPQAAVDRDPSTAWIAGVGDPSPTLTLRLPSARTITGVVLQTGPDVPASRPLTVTIETPGRSVAAVVDADGVARIPAVRTDIVTVRFGATSPLRSLDPQRGITTQLPVGVSEAFLRGALDLGQGVRRSSATGVPCGFGPVLELDGAPSAQTSVATTVGTLLTGQPTTAQGCSGTVHLTAGAHRIRVRSTPELSVTDVVLAPLSARTPARPTEPAVRSWTSVDRVVSVDPADHARLLELSENANAGWVATMDGRALAATSVDGWRQAWVVPARASGDVEISFAPDRAYRAGLLAGAGAVIVLLLLALAPGRVRPDPAPPVRPAPSRARSLLTTPTGRRVVVAAVVVIVGGAWGALAVVVGALLLLRARHRARWVGLAATVAAAAAAGAPWPGSLDRPAVGAVASVLTLVAVTTACWAWSAPARDPSPQP